MNEIKAVIFDLDGVICSTDQFHYLAWKALADRLGISFDEEKNKLLRGVSRMDSLKIILGEHLSQYTESELITLAEEKNAKYQNFLSLLTPDDLTEDVRQTLLTLRQRGYLLAVGSSSRNTMLILNRLGLGNFFDAVADGTQISHSKPDPEVFLLASTMLKVPPENAVVIEDADSGIQAASAGHFHSIGLRSVTNDPNSEISIKRLSNLLEIL